MAVVGVGVGSRSRSRSRSSGSIVGVVGVVGIVAKVCVEQKGECRRPSQRPRKRLKSPRGQPKRAAQESNPRGLCTLEAIDSCSHIARTSLQEKPSGEGLRRSQADPGGARRS